jgi:starch phosphorylase
MLSAISNDALARAVASVEWLQLYDEALAGLDAARTARNTWCAREYPTLTANAIAYFSAEFALHQSLPIYAGGLGVLAGDHCKEASDLGVPLVGIGFMYPQGYFHQVISPDGWQEERYERLTWEDAPIEPALTPDGKPCVSAVPLGDRTVLAAVWRVRAGRVTLYLLDTDLPENAPQDRELSARLYGGDRDTRLQQEIVLGIGGVRALRALGLSPALYHLNEGHAAFVVLQRIRDLCEHGQTFDTALAEVRRTTVFTTHTPVPAGHDAFSFGMVEAHLAGLWGDLGDNRARFLDLGSHDNGAGPMFNMTALAMRSAGSVNGVSQLHGEVTRQMWQPLWPELPVNKVPVKSLTNGVHVPTWMSSEIARLLDRYLGPTGARTTTTRQLCDRVLEIPTRSCGTRAWRCARSSSSSCASARGCGGPPRAARRRAWWPRARCSTRARSPSATRAASPATSGPSCSSPIRSAWPAILNKWGPPVQFVFAGKAHPADDIGKHHLQHIYHRALDPMFGGRIAVVDDYDLHVAHFLVQGATCG